MAIQNAKLEILQQACEWDEGIQIALEAWRQFEYEERGARTIPLGISGMLMRKQRERFVESMKVQCLHALEKRRELEGCIWGMLLAIVRET